MRFIFYSPVAFEKWNWENSITKGIGGSETSHVEMAWRLARRGHEVITYAPIPKRSPTSWRNTKWYPIERADFKLKGIWILYRCPEVVDKFFPINKRVDQKIWLMMQDWDYPQWTTKRINNTDRIITLCQAHGLDVIKKHPETYQNLWLTSNGIKTDLIAEVEKKQIKRDPYRIMYASSPDRGLKQGLLIFQKVKEYIPQATFHSFYGFNNLDKLIKQAPYGRLAKLKNEIMPLLKQEGVVFHGRVSQPKLYEEWFKSGIYLYITDFCETSHISGQEAQAMGAVPVFSPIYAQGENIGHGVRVAGASTDPLTISRAAGEVIKLMANLQLQEQIRPTMMKWARERFDWENFVTQWEMEAMGKRNEFEKRYSFPTQLEEHVNVNSRFFFSHKPFEKKTQDFLKNVKGKTVLDVGGYDGKQAQWCMDQGAKSATVVDNQTWKIYDKWPEFKPFKSVTYINDDIMNYTKPADIVICQNVVYHVRNPWAFTERLRNLTKKTLVLSTSYVKGDQAVWRVYRPYEGHPVSWTVAWRPTLEGLTALLEANGFQILDRQVKKGSVTVKCKPVKPPIGFKKL